MEKRSQHLSAALAAAFPHLDYRQRRVVIFVTRGDATLFSDFWASASALAPVRLTEAGALPAIIFAAEALIRNTCEVAVILAADFASAHDTRLEAASILLENAGSATVTSYAIMTAGLARTVTNTDRLSNADLLFEACARAQTISSDLSLLTLHGEDEAGITMALETMAPVVSAVPVSFLIVPSAPYLPVRVLWQS